MNDKDLILNALGQVWLLNHFKYSILDCIYLQRNADTSPEDTTPRIPHVPSFEYPMLRNRTPGQFPSEMLCLNVELNEAE